MRWMIVAAAGLAMGAGQPEKEPGRGPGRPAPERDGPWRHQIHLVTSENGLTFEEVKKPIMRRASVPDLIELTRDLPKGAGAKKGALCIYVVDARDRDEPGGEALARLVSGDGGKIWGEPERVEVRWPEGDEKRLAVDPAVVQLTDGRLRLYFLAVEPPAENGKPEKPAEPEKVEPFGIKPLEVPGEPRREREAPARRDEKKRPVIRSAVSDDGLRFKVEEGVRFEDGGVTDPEVVKVGDEWLMFLSRGEQVVLARSADGLGFEKERGFVLRGGGVPGAAVLSDGRVRVYQSGREGITSVVYDPRMGTFKPEDGVRVAGPSADPSIWPLAGGGYAGVVKRWMNAPSAK